ncbi:hypothetical protein LVJ94_03395 [Pendulispora rubella]|uniref:RCC1-like domain-containing protein n=1 Tax=Pendulispora rubella TaxID=2741070 RepID=A0ABZ2L5S7_9BACT
MNLSKVLIPGVLALMGCAGEVEAVDTAESALGLGDVQLSVGGDHSCVFKSNKVFCWGFNYDGQLGDGSNTYRPSPVVVETAPGAALKGAKVVALGDEHSCALLGTREARCWGSNRWGELGNGETMSSYRPVTVDRQRGAPLKEISALALGHHHSCALLDSEVRCWGDNDTMQLGDGTTVERTLPVTVQVAGVALRGVKTLAAGGGFNCALLDSDEVRCWGSNYAGQLGNGTTASRSEVVTVETAPGVPLRGVKALALGMMHTCALLATGEVHCWGYNVRGQLGDGTTVDRAYPAPVKAASGTPLKGVKAISSGEHHSCALLDNGQMRCWGYNKSGQLGDATTTNRAYPVVVENSPGVALSGVTDISLGILHSCAVLNRSQVRCWGYNGAGQLGDGTTTTRLYPVKVELPAL